MNEENVMEEGSNHPPVKRYFTDKQFSTDIDKVGTETSISSLD